MMRKGAKVIIGDNCFFDNDSFIAGNKLIDIGEGVFFGEGVTIYDYNHRFYQDEPLKELGYSDGEVYIGKHCWIGSGSIFLKVTYISEWCDRSWFCNLGIGIRRSNGET